MVACPGQAIAYEQDPSRFRRPRHGGTLSSIWFHLGSRQKSPFQIADPCEGIEGIFTGIFLVFLAENTALKANPNVLRQL